MEKLHKLIQTLQASPQKVKLLQEINSQLLSRFRLKITEGIFLYPLEVEAYYNDGDQFEDSSPATAMRCSMTGSANYISTASEQPTPSTKTGAEQISASLPGTACATAF